MRSQRMLPRSMAASPAPRGGLLARHEQTNISFFRKEAVEKPVVEVDVMADPPGNPRVLWISFLAFTLGFAVWGMFSALSPFLIKWYGFSATQVLVLAAMEPFFAAAVSIPLGIWTDKFGGRTVFTLLLLSLAIILFCGLFAQGYYS